MRARFLMGAVGAAGAAYGAWLLLAQDYVAAALWLAAGVVLHDFVIVPLTLGVGWLAFRLSPAAARRPLVVGFVVLGTTTLLAVPVLGGWGANPDNPTILDRDYVRGWLVVAGVAAGAVVVSGWWLARRARPGRPPRPWGGRS